MAVVDTLPIRETGDRALEKELRRRGLGLGVAEARRVAELLGRNPGLTELTIFDTMWSEHCSYKSSRAVLREFLPTDASNVVIGPGQDAGIIRLGVVDGVSWCLVVAHESHNHPSQVLPFEGAATGIGGIVRDVYCMGAEVIAVLDPLRFGDPRGPNGDRVREIARGVVHGIWSYGNALGVPNFGGDIVFDAGFDDNCLVNVVAVGIVREDRIVPSSVPAEAGNEPYDLILVGKPTDASGFGGAAFASETLEETGENRGAVQVPDPFLKRVLAEANKRMLDRVFEAGAKIGFKDLGAGGIACALCEMGAAGGFGVEIDLDAVPVAEVGLPPRVLSCSETQERFAIAVPRRFSREILTIYNQEFELPHVYHGARAAVIGRVIRDPSFRIRKQDRLLCQASTEAITTGVRIDRPAARASRSAGSAALPRDADLGRDLLEILGRPNVTSRAYVFEQYDSEVQGRAVLRPGEADAGVLAPLPGSSLGVALSCDGLPGWRGLDPYCVGAHAVLEAARNVACVGGVPSAITDCLNFGSPESPEVFHEFVEGVRGVGDAARAIGLRGRDGEPLPVVSGNVSFYNEGPGGRSIPSSPIVTCVGIVADYAMCRTLTLKEPGDDLYLLLPPRGCLGAGEYARMRGLEDLPAPRLDLDLQRRGIHAVLDAVEGGIVLAAHDVSVGGLLVAVAEMLLGRWGGPGRGARLDLACEAFEGLDPRAVAFSEEGSFLLEVAPASGPELDRIARDHALEALRIGAVTREACLSVRFAAGVEVEWDIRELCGPWTGGLERAMGGSAGEGPRGGVI